tara:strand:- start:602 stop:901 length:300 start_codon:yes stop_codon:yes gene_type:complete
MDYEARQELLFKIQEKVEEIMSIIENSKFSDECMALYCFGVGVDEMKSKESDVYEYITGYSVDNTDEIKMMLETVAKGYINSIDKPNHPTDSIDYWLNL